MSSSEADPRAGFPPTPSLSQSGGREALSRRSLILAPLVLAACGFTPAYGPGAAATKLVETVRVADPYDKNSFDLVERLEERLGRPESHLYDLAYTIRTDVFGVGVTTDNEITRYNLKGVIDFTLTEKATGARLTGGQVQSFTAYSATGSTVAGLAAEEDAALRLMRILADQIVTRLIAASAAFP
ncbi:LPS assembly lipoprotein LptE [Tabrizicola sp. BL-A-41-H6]|uniref:LPS assembly lipoprotein LptE n=1 Tax=Tabrizicola sp. BL-A-41-H6 TaxID=3421107 RepID=UPI003D669622